MSKKGFVIVEVLVAFIILTTTITLLVYTQKNFNTTIKRVQNYENIYMTLLSLKNKIDIELQLGDKEHYEGKLNDINYQIDLKKINEGKNRTYDNMEGKHMDGRHTYMLYSVKISLLDMGKEYMFYKLKTHIEKSAFEDEFKRTQGADSKDSNINGNNIDNKKDPYYDEEFH